MHLNPELVCRLYWAFKCNLASTYKIHYRACKNARLNTHSFENVEEVHHHDLFTFFPIFLTHNPESQ